MVNEEIWKPMFLLGLSYKSDSEEICKLKAALKDIIPLAKGYSNMCPLSKDIDVIKKAEEISR